MVSLFTFILAHQGDAADPELLRWIKERIDHLFGPGPWLVVTLMGLIIMLGNMDDPSSIGSGMAVALITTLYGAIFSNLFCLPFAEKLGFLNQQELLAMEIVIRGIASIQSGDNPRIVEQRLNTFIPPKLRTTEDKNEAA